ncbi:MAG: bifunctional UDP-N-acetylglucosamine diphosphorylase/glucosamine-1-phosphate N-acetyltransferase GlmU [Proteobacteria bacterium]|nr:bifunctional UDP-N-acetylglucosamine diphosphorylase/glucosamine-1-phosphate N-acetyltransferase GlmU [Pseudomonadota bacterium]
MPEAKSPRAAVILAAGQGTRMKSPLPKVLHPVGGRAMLDRAIDAAERLGCERIVVVVGTHSPSVGEHVVKRLGEASVAVQDPPMGTGHAVLAAKEALAGFDGDVLITYADVPLLDAPQIEPLFALRGEGADVAVLGFEAKDPSAYGRLVVSGGGVLEAIVEAKEATPEQLAITACNSGVMAAPSGLLFELLAQVRNDNAKGEYYLTDVVGLARAAGRTARVGFASEDDVMGVNSQSELADAERVFQTRTRSRLMAEGVSMIAPETVWFSWDTVVEAGVRIEPNVVFGPKAKVESGAWIRAFSHIEGAVVKPGAHVGPYARLRPGAEIGPDAHIGNFVEVKNVKVGQGAKANHLAYLGDGEVGAKANIGAGTIFCNYDGFDKARTVVGAGAFVGSNSSLVAPVSIGAGAYTGSGSVITKDVADNALAFERGPQTEKPGWAERFREAKRARKGLK